MILPILIASDLLSSIECRVSWRRDSLLSTWEEACKLRWLRASLFCDIVGYDGAGDWKTFGGASPGERSLIQLGPLFDTMKMPEPQFLSLNADTLPACERTMG